VASDFENWAILPFLLRKYTNYISIYKELKLTHHPLHYQTPPHTASTLQRRVLTENSVVYLNKEKKETQKQKTMKVFVLLIDRYSFNESPKTFNSEEKAFDFAVNYIYDMLLDNEQEDQYGTKEEFVAMCKEKFPNVEEMNGIIFDSEDLFFQLYESEVM
jgi:hypothetical protein